MKLTLFYDSHCPLCMAEMNQLRKYDTGGQISLVDLHQVEFEKQYPQINKSQALDILHAQLPGGEILMGLDANVRAWSLVGKYKWLAVLRWPGIKLLADAGYLFFARYRAPISKLLTGNARCQTGSCGTGKAR